MNLKKFKTLFLNLNKSKERLEFITSQLNKTKLQYERIEAIDGMLIPDKEKYLSRKIFKCMSCVSENIYRRVGLFKSQMKALKHAIDNKYDGVIIFEDDVNIHSDFDIDVDIPDDCDILYLNGGLWTIKGKETFDKTSLPPNSVTKIKDFKLVGAYAYIIPSLDKIKKVYEILSMNKMTTYDIALINYVQSLGTCYLYTNKLVNHEDTFDSTITKSWNTVYKIQSIL